MTVMPHSVFDVRRLLQAQQTVAVQLANPDSDVLERVLATLCEAAGWSLAVLWERDAERDELVASAVWPAPDAGGLGALATASLEHRFSREAGLPGLVWATGASAWVHEPRFDPRMAAMDESSRQGLRSAVAVPVRHGADVDGVLELHSVDEREEEPELLLWLEVVATQLAEHLTGARLRKTLQGRDRALTHAVNGVVIADATSPGFPIVYANPGFERLTGYRAEEIAGLPCSVLQHADTDREQIEVMRSALAAGREAHVTVLNRRKDGSSFWNEVFLSPVFDDGRLVEYIGVQNDVTERRNAESHADFLAYHDSLTGLGNRALLSRVLTRAAQRVERHGVRAALAFLDIDAFKQLNDQRGHLVGDEVLRRIADRLRAVVRPNDLLVRQGGDEFLLLMPDLEARGAAQEALAAAERMRLAIAEPMTLGGGDDVRLRVSVGVSLLGGDARDTNEAMRHADTAMYRAKRVSRGGVRLYRDTGAVARPAVPAPAPEPAPVAPAAQRAAALEAVIAGQGVQSIYQPIVDLDTGAIVAYEALARGPRGSLLEMPDDLFTTARETDRLGELDWVCRGAALRGALDGGLQSPRKLFVNVEADALALPCPAELEELWGVESRGLDVIVEITERALTARPADLLHLVREVRRRGWGIALDDVGADVRSLAVMPLLRPDVIKLDLRLIQHNPTPEIAEIVSAVNAETERTGATVLAEGIETEAHVEIARAMGATLGQGWLFGRPGPLSPPTEPPTRPLVVTSAPEIGDDVSPYEVVRRVREVRRGDKQLLFAISLQLEQQAAALGECALIVSAFQHVERFTPLTAKRYTLLGVDTAFVAALGVGMPAEPAPGVRGAELPAGDPLRGEWSVVVLGPHFAAALVAMDLGDDGEDMQRGFDFAVTYDREVVIEAASALMRRVQPLTS
jgi:diguanylate cyclase (GGDEF)-like protein/PAS domain S-box-containing protein